ncbi:MAG: TraU family protein [Gammaproteobacteria bacterium]|nr:TraU family protein [Gammaproteobacteria bacterium]
MAILPDLINEGASPNLSGYKVPEYLNDSKVQPVQVDSDTKDKLDESGLGFDTSKIKIPSMADVVNTIKQKLIAAIRAFGIIQQIEEVLSAVQTIKNIKEDVNTIMDGFEATSMTAIASSGWGNLARPRFAAPRLFCPTNIKPFQPYYLSFADAFWWRSGYPLTDGPISGTDHSKTIINPLSKDTLQKVNTTTEVLTKEIWGNMYPRDGSINQSHDAKTASVLAWRGLDVLKTAVKPGYRVGVELPASIEGGKWQMIFPQVKSCRADPYYPQGKNLKIDSLKPSGYGGYAWNYYKTYACCSNTSGHRIGELSMPKVCLSLGNIMAGIEEDRAAYQQYLINQESSQGGE